MSMLHCCWTWPPHYLHIQYPVCFVVVIICKVSPRKS